MDNYYKHCENRDTRIDLKVYKTELLGPQHAEQMRRKKFTKEEFKGVIMRMKNNKTRFHGIPAEVWKMLYTIKE